MGKTEEGQPITGNHTSRFSGSSYVSTYPRAAAQNAVSHPSNANTLAAPDLLDPSYWQAVPPGISAHAPFAHGGDTVWENVHQGVSPVLLEYGQYTLDVHASVLPQTVFRPGEALHNLPMTPIVDKDASINSKLYDSSDMLGAMVLDDGPGQSSWNVPSDTQAEYEGPRCIELSESDATGSSWAGSERIDETTVSPKMLRLRQTPSPSSSCESIRTSFIADGAVNQPLTFVDSMPCHASEPVGASRKTRRLRSDRSQRPLLPSSGMSQRQPSAYSNPPSPPRKLTRLRPKPKMAGMQPLSSPSPPPPPPPVVAEGPQPQLAHRAPPGISSGARERIELPDRMSKDDFLVRQKQMGMTYKEIRRLGGFTEAESTLRGRYRTLTKVREARVRKPEWSEKDVSFVSVVSLFAVQLVHPPPTLIPYQWPSIPISFT